MPHPFHIFSLSQIHTHTHTLTHSHTHTQLKALSVVKEKDLLDQEHDQNCLSPKELSTAQRIKVQTALDKSFSEENGAL